MKTLLCGDCHADTWNAKDIFKLAEKEKCDRIHFFGDFGYFLNLPECQAFLEYVSFNSIQSKIPVSFTDGNHENHYSLKRLFEKRVSETIFVMPGIEWWWRGKYSDIDSQKILSIGGAYSIDKNHRQVGVDWFENEIISYADFLRCDKECDIIFSHDCPLPIDFGFKNDEFTEANRKMLTEICEQTNPKILIHGHYHKFYWMDLKMNYGNLRVIGLGKNGQELNEQCVILENGLVKFL